MSTQPPDRKNVDMDMDQDQDQDHLDLSADGDAASSDEETIKGELEQENFAEALEEELDEDASNPPPARGSVAASRYHQLLKDQADMSDEGSSMDDLPRRAGSPMNSLLSVPDDSPSVQVRGTTRATPSSPTNLTFD